ncbi:MAG: DUF2939 domain-containing protein [Gemmatimonadales bacterium]
MKRRTSRFPWLVLLALVLVAAWYWVAPRRTWDRFLRAVAVGDGIALEQVVDFSSVRIHLKSDLRRSLETRNGGITRAATPVLGGVVIDPLVDMIVSPSGLEQLITSFGTRNVDVAQQTIVSFRYRSLSRVDVHVRSSVDPEREAGVFTFERSGVTWRLSRVWSDRLTSAEG